MIKKTDYYRVKSLDEMLESIDIGMDVEFYLYNVNRVPGGTKAKVLCGASRIYDEKIGKRSYSFVAKSPLHTTNVSRVLLPKQPRRVCVNGKEELEPGKLWEERSGTLLLRFENDPAGVQVDIEW